MVLEYYDLKVIKQQSGSMKTWKTALILSSVVEEAEGWQSDPFAILALTKE